MRKIKHLKTIIFFTLEKINLFGKTLCFGLKEAERESYFRKSYFALIRELKIKMLKPN